MELPCGQKQKARQIALQRQRPGRACRRTLRVKGKGRASPLALQSQRQNARLVARAAIVRAQTTAIEHSNADSGEQTDLENVERSPDNRRKPPQRGPQ